MTRELPLRIVVVRPPPGVRFAVQSGRADLLPPTQESPEALVFELSVRLGSPRPDGGPRLMPPLAHGPPDARFLYVNSGTSAGQLDSPWTRRAKISTGGIDARLVEEAVSTPGAVLEACVEGRARDGGPCCASVPLLEGGWRIVRGKYARRYAEGVNLVRLDPDVAAVFPDSEAVNQALRALAGIIHQRERRSA